MGHHIVLKDETRSDEFQQESEQNANNETDTLSVTPGKDKTALHEKPTTQEKNLTRTGRRLRRGRGTKPRRKKHAREKTSHNKATQKISQEQAQEKQPSEEEPLDTDQSSAEESAISHGSKSQMSEDSNSDSAHLQLVHSTGKNTQDEAMHAEKTTSHASTAFRNIPKFETDPFAHVQARVWTALQRRQDPRALAYVDEIADAVFTKVMRDGDFDRIKTPSYIEAHTYARLPALRRRVWSHGGNGRDRDRLWRTTCG